MKMLTEFLRREDGAVTVDWVVLTAMVIALWAIAFQMMSDGANSLADDTATYMDSIASN